MTSVVAVDHRFDDLDIESEVLAPLGAKLEDARGLERDAVLRMCAHADAILLGARFRFDAEAVGMLGRCKAIVRYGIGYDNVDVDAATAAGVWVAYVPDYCVEEVANHTLAALLAFNRRLHELDGLVRAGEWGIPAGFPVRRLSTCVLGVIGFGRIGEAVGRRGVALGMRVLACDPMRARNDIEAAGAVPVELESLLAESDYVSLHAPRPPVGFLLGAAELAQLKPSALVLNVGRAGLLDEAALIDCLSAGRIGGAALDVTAVEPLHPPHPLLETRGVLLTPHSAWYSLEAIVELRTKAAEEAARALRGERPRYSANAIQG